jgi:L-arabinose isomerase
MKAHSWRNIMELEKYEIWFITGSQHLYGEETIKQVAKHAQAIASDLEPKLPVKLIFKPVVTTPDAIRKLCMDANSNDSCAGIVTWMHTFSPAKMWIAGLSLLTKPMLHLHTQFNRDIPWATIDMDFMNLNQSAHGDREFGYIGSRLRMPRKVVVGHYQDTDVVSRMDAWIRAACAFADGKLLKVMRFGDNMREVAVTEGDKVEAQIKFGWSVNGYGLGGLEEGIKNVTTAEVEALAEQYQAEYEFSADALSGKGLESVKGQARIEIAMRKLLESIGAKAFTTTFEDLHGLQQLPGLAVQHLMANGYGFGAEGDWKTAAMVRAMKVMAEGLDGGVSFMEDYTYHFEPGNELVLGAHMLEVCPSIASGKARMEVHPLGIGGKSDPARLVFESKTGAGLNASLVDMGERFRLILNAVQTVKMPEPMPSLPVARVLWKPEPSLKAAAEAWILAGGAHHTGYSTAVTMEHMEDWAEMAGVECLVIDKSLNLRSFRSEIRANDSVWKNMR